MSKTLGFWYPFGEELLKLLCWIYPINVLTSVQPRLVSLSSSCPACSAAPSLLWIPTYFQGCDFPTPLPSRELPQTNCCEGSGVLLRKLCFLPHLLCTKFLQISSFTNKTCLAPGSACCCSSSFLSAGSTASLLQASSGFCPLFCCAFIMGFFLA